MLLCKSNWILSLRIIFSSEHVYILINAHPSDLFRLSAVRIVEKQNLKKAMSNLFHYYYNLCILNKMQKI